jgi:hypothetical protein
MFNSYTLNFHFHLTLILFKNLFLINKPMYFKYKKYNDQISHQITAFNLDQY